jgi:hypothetical protein
MYGPYFISPTMSPWWKYIQLLYQLVLFDLCEDIFSQGKEREREREHKMHRKVTELEI